MATDKIKEMYDQLYKSKYDALLKQKEQQLTGLSGRDSEINNNFNSTKSELERKRQDVADNYQQKYNQLNLKADEGKKKYYGDRNNAAYSNAKNTQAIRDYYAKNNLLQSGESVDALLRNTTNFNNNLGNIYSNEQSFNRDIDSTRNQYSSEEKSYYSQIDDSLANALAEKDRLLAELQAQRDTINNTFNNDVNSIKSEIEYKKLKDIQAYEEQLRQEAYQKQLQEEQRKWQAEQDRIQREWQAEQDRLAWERQLSARSYSGGGGYSRSGGGYSRGGGSSSNNVRSDLQNEVNYTLQNMTGHTQTRNLIEQAYSQGYLTDDERSDYINKINSNLNVVKKTQAQVNKGTYGKPSYKKNGLTHSRL